MSDRLEEALAEVLARKENGDVVAPEWVRAQYPEFSEPICDALEIQGLLARAGAAREVAERRIPLETKLRTVEIGRYEGFSLLGEGGMGLVYWAVDTDLNREVAFKVIRPDAGVHGAELPRAPTNRRPPAEDGPRALLSVRHLTVAFPSAGGVTRVLEIFRTEIEHTMAMAGCASVADFDRSLVTASPSPVRG